MAYGSAYEGVGAGQRAMAISMPDIYKIRVAGAAESAARTVLEARKHTITVDEPAERGGTDLAASPLETLLSSLLACTNVITNMVAARMGIEIEGMSLELVGHFDSRGVFDKAEVTVPFPVIEMKVALRTGAGEAEVTALKQAVATRCPVSVILRQAGCRIDDVWTIERPGG